MSEKQRGTQTRLDDKLAMEVVGDVIIGGFRIPGDLNVRVRRFFLALMVVAIIALSVTLAAQLT